MTTPEEQRIAAVVDIAHNRRLAHDVIFRTRHPNLTPDFHHEIQDLIHSNIPNVLILAFRGSGKSTIVEEAITIQAALGEFRNCIILSATRQRAIDRLTSIAYELTHNEMIQAIFGDLQGEKWLEDKLVLSNVVCVQALGPGQSMRGIKYLEYRPDRLIIDDLEDEESIRDEQARAQLRSWLRRVVFPACTPKCLTRMFATPMDPDSLPMHLMRASNWEHRVYPIYSVGADGAKRSSWPDLYPIEWIEAREEEYRAMAATQEFAQEYECRPEDPQTKVFTEAMLKVEPRVRTWHACYAAYDPARSVSRTSATTGHVVFSWIGRKLVIWRGGADLWMPSEIIDDIVKVNAQYTPVAIGVENTGLVEFIDQPLRQKALAMGLVLPIVALRPPRGKADFIRALQPYFRAGEIEWASAIDPEARAQLLAFPTGRKDFPNALAYALHLRPGLPVFGEFSSENIAEELPIISNEPVFLVVNATAQHTTAVLVQMIAGGLRIVRDWVREGPPGEVLGDLVMTASMETGRTLALRCPPGHFSDYDMLGLRAAAGKIPVRLTPCGPGTNGREVLRALMTRQRQGRSLLLVATTARWTLNGFSGGYAQGLRVGVLSDAAVEGPYRVLMEGLESLMAVADRLDDKELPPRYATDSKGRRYITTLGGEPERPLKSDWAGTS